MRSLTLFFCIIFFSTSSNSNTYALKIKEYGLADLTIKVKEYGLADETWKVKGACTGAISYTSVKIKEYGTADLTVKIKSYGLADRKVCIKNPNDLPYWFLNMID